ncbi:chemosensory pili system protein ChpA (sensor histidine kinase/response regulator) [Oxalobacteraceae bacterium GrIS 1.11]
MTTTDFPQPHMPPQFDTGPLSWVMLEIREALGRSKTALFEAGGRQFEDRATSLQHAKSHLHQAHGALLMVDVDGVGMMTAAAEQVLERFKQGTLECNVDNAQTVANLYLALIEYLEELLAGAPSQPVRLFPYYRPLQELLGAERIHPADLFFPHVPAQLNIRSAAHPVPQDYPAYRKRFEKALLPYLKSSDAAAQVKHAEVLHEAVKLVADAQHEAPARTFWCALQSFAELVAAGQLTSGLYVKQLFGLINLQMRRLTQGTATLPEGMLRDALFFIASAAHPTPGARQLRQAYRLDGLVPADYESLRYGQVDPQALARAKQGLALAKTSWGRLAAAEVDPGLDAAFAQALAQVALEAEKLKVPALSTLMRQLGEVALKAVKSGRSPDLDLEMATALLFAEHALEQIRRLSDDFVSNAETIGARLNALVSGETPPAPSQWQGEMSRQIEQDETVAVLATEMKAALRQVEKLLDDYYADAAKRPALVEIEPLLHQLQGALAMLDQEQAMRAALHVKAKVQQLAQGSGEAAGEAHALDEIAQNVGALGFFVDMLGHNVEAAKGRFHFDEVAGTFRAIPFEKIAAADPVPMLEEELAPVVVPEPPAPPVTSDAAIEAELLEIFIIEAQEVLGFVKTTLAKPRAECGSAEHLAMLRRSFHTLKGSGRMVGLNRFAEAAAAIERVMNVWLGEERVASDALFALLARALTDMEGWVAELLATGTSERSADALVSAAERVQMGAAFEMDEASAPIGSVDLDEGVAPELVPEAAPEAGNVIEFPSATTPARDDNLKQIGDLEIGLPLYNIYLAETDELLRLLTVDFSEWSHEPGRAVSDEAQHAAHTLTGSSGTVGFKALRELAHALESAIEVAVPSAPSLSQAQRALLDQVTETIRQMLQQFALGELAPAQPDLIVALQAMREQLIHPQPGIPATELGGLEVQLDSLFTDTYQSIVSEPLAGEAAASLETVVAELPLAPTAPALPDAGGADDVHDSMFDDAFAVPPAIDSVAELPVAELAGVEFAPLEDAAPAEAAHVEEALEAAPDEEVIEAAAVEEVIEAAPVAEVVEAAPVVEEVAHVAEIAPLEEIAHIEEVVEAAPTEAVAPATAAIELAPVAPIVFTAPIAPVQELAAVGAVFSDELDADLLPIFLEEGADLLPQVGKALRIWQQNPADTSQGQLLLRVLHTVKGSARMAGAMRLGQHAHEIETHIENMLHAGTATPHAFEELLAHYDHALLLFEQLQLPIAAQTAAPVAAVAAAAAPGREDSPAAETKVALVRVRADILDRLVNQAGEVSITRSKLENEIGQLRSSLVEFSDNLARLRRQLREVEMQAESQIASRMAISSEREFDPLEFDRFTRLQELTRMMAEGVNDVASFHENLARSVDSASDDLAQQARLTRDLQQDLMRVRMVPFASISERLFRVARQSAKEVDKRVNLDIRGSAVEIDRSVLERMAAPFEHLLRNAIAHGVETRAERTAAGKSETGELLVQVSQQGNEVVIGFSDDGAGLDLNRIRAKARSIGLLGPDQEVSDAQATDLIFEPGFSTADTLTELSGRGVGMDIVRSEALALGGRVDTVSQLGHGVRFTIHLPLTLAVTQVVLLSCDEKVYAVPAILVEQVLQIKEAGLVEAYSTGTMQSQGQSVALHYLSNLLGETHSRPHSQRSSPVLMLKSGNDRLALQVDEVLGNREVVIKNIGPQLARMAGIAGATVLGSGDIVLILNPVALAQHLEHQPELRPQYVATASESLTAPRSVIMVVDDSLTVRRVSQRLLEREGYHVILAKDGVDALEQLQGVTPELMMVDIEMPRMDGFDLTRNVRGDVRTQGIPIIMITSRSADKHRNYALELGVNAYFGKPFQEEALLAAIKGLLHA